MKPPTRKLIGGVRESHTKEYLFQISAQTSGCRGRSKFRAQEQQEQRNHRKNSSFRGEREREWKKRCQQGVPVGPRRVFGAARGWPRHLASWARGGPLGQPQVPPDGILPGYFYYEFSGIFWATSLWRIFQSSKSCKNFRELEAKV